MLRWETPWCCLSWVHSKNGTSSFAKLFERPRKPSQNFVRNKMSDLLCLRVVLALLLYHAQMDIKIIDISAIEMRGQTKDLRGHCVTTLLLLSGCVTGRPQSDCIGRFLWYDRPRTLKWLSPCISLYRTLFLVKFVLTQFTLGSARSPIPTKLMSFISPFVTVCFWCFWTTLQRLTRISYCIYFLRGLRVRRSERVFYVTQHPITRCMHAAGPDCTQSNA
jgi:hypothetical protein